MNGPVAFSVIPGEDAGANAMTTVYTAYECETSESQKRPNTLLDALERGEQRSGEDARPAAAQVASGSMFSLLSKKKK